MSYDYADSEGDASVIADLRKRVAELETALRQAAAPQGREALKAETIPWKDDKRQFPLYELAPDLTLIDRDPQADERLKLYRDIFAEITAKAIPICDPTSDDPERVRHYQIPVGPLHRAAGKLGFQLFNGEQYLADAVKEIARLKALTPAVAPDGAGEQMTAVNDLPLLWRCRAASLRILDGERGVPDEGTLGEADGYIECAKELHAALTQAQESGEESKKHYSWIGDDCPPQWKRVGTIDVADPADVATALDKGRRIGTIYDGKSYSVAEPCAADIYAKRDEMADNIPPPQVDSGREAVIEECALRPERSGGRA